MTRAVKAAGAYWLLWKPRAGGRGHRRQIGILAPKATIAAAQTRAAETAQARARARAVGARARGRQEERYAGQLTAAIVAYLSFADEHAGLAAEIAREAAGRAAVVGSGRVGRTRLIPLEERAALATRAYIRHRHTRYEDDLDRLAFRHGWTDEFLYREVKARAQQAVDRFIADHRGT